MELTKKTVSADAVDSAKAQERRAKIIQALRRCIAHKGYAATSFNEIAREAGMSPSHVFYYFRGKDAVLKELYREITRQFLVRMDALQDASLETKLRAMMDYAFSGGDVSHEDRLVFAEIIGQSMSNPSLEDIRETLPAMIMKSVADVLQSSILSQHLHPQQLGLVSVALGTGLMIYVNYGMVSESEAKQLMQRIAVGLEALEQSSAIDPR